MSVTYVSRVRHGDIVQIRKLTTGTHSTARSSMYQLCFHRQRRDSICSWHPGAFDSSAALLSRNNYRRGRRRENGHGFTGRFIPDSASRFSRGNGLFLLHHLAIFTAYERRFLGSACPWFSVWFSIIVPPCRVSITINNHC